MHMADALISAPVAGVMGAASAASLVYAGRGIKDEVEGKVPLMAVTGAFVFAAQMVNFAIPGAGASGHLGGGVLLAAFLGGFPALFTITAVLAIQCLFFGDGGLLAFGCNVFNMGVIPCLAVYPLIYRPVTKKLTAFRLSLAAVLASVVSLQLGALGVVLETYVSGVTNAPLWMFAALMQPVHLAIGAVEGAVTAAVLVFVYKARPGVLAREKDKKHVAQAAVGFAVLAAITGGLVSTLASGKPDGLEWAAGRAFAYAAPEARYDGFGVPASGLAGGLLVFALCAAVGLVINIVKKRRKKVDG
jgi:cobalt/nickel transport system permease protein